MVLNTYSKNFVNILTLRIIDLFPEGHGEHKENFVNSIKVSCELKGNYKCLKT